MSRILVVEDDPAVRNVVERALSQEGLPTVGVESGEEALERLRKSAPFDLVVLDVILPGMDGFSVCREIRAGATGEANKEVPVVMLTIRGDDRSVVMGLEAEADDYISKPFFLPELLSRVKAHLTRSA